MKYFIFLLFPFISISVNQPPQPFGLESENVVANKPADFFTFYLPNLFFNNTGEDLQLRWVKESVVENYDNTTATGLWNYTIQDPDNFHNDAVSLDSSDFVLPAVTESTDQLILQVYPDNVSGNVVFTFRIYNINDPSQSFIVNYDYTATPISTTVQNLENVGIKVFPNPSSDFITIQNDSNEKGSFSILNQDGRMIQNDIAISSGELKTINTTHYQSGVFLLQYTKGNQVWIQQIIKE